ncbi:MAG: hypothetical protein JNJ61_01995 [Anaerolineae bacterium]|nr:hypothetical protein [Anaerolineae bacterium]
MKRVLIVLAVVAILIIGGGLTSQLASTGNATVIPGLIRQTDDPDASALDMTPWKAEQLFLMVGFVLFNLIGIAVTIAALMWFLNWQVKKVSASRSKTAAPATTPATE